MGYILLCVLATALVSFGISDVFPQGQAANQIITALTLLLSLYVALYLTRDEK